MKYPYFVEHLIWKIVSTLQSKTHVRYLKISVLINHRHLFSNLCVLSFLHVLNTSVQIKAIQ